MIAEALSLTFFQHAIIAAILAGVACGVIGSLVVAKEISSLSGGLAHAAFGGIGLAYLLDWHPTVGAATFGVLAAVALGYIYRKHRDRLDTLTMMVWSVGMALGIVFIALSPGYTPELTSYLFGSILFVSTSYLWLVLVLDLILVVIVAAMFKELQSVTFDEEFSEIVGKPVTLLIMLLLGLIALAVVVLIRVVGVILTLALLTIPAVMARQWTRSLRAMMLVAVILSWVVSLGGLFLSYWASSAWSLNIPTGPIIILVAAVAYGVSSLINNFRRVTA